MNRFKYEDIGERAIFGKFLYNLAKQRSYEGPRNVAKAIYNNKKYFELAKPAGRIDQILSKKEKDISTISKAVKRHMCLESAEQVPGNYMLVYSDLFNCSMDFLYGKIDEDCPNMDTLAISKRLNISCEAIQNIQKITRGNIKSISSNKIEFYSQKRAAISLMLSAPQLEDYISEICELATALEHEVKPHKYEEGACKSIDPNVRNKAYDCMDGVVFDEDQLPSQEVISAAKRISDARDRDFAESVAVESSVKRIKVSKCSVMEAHYELEKYLTSEENRGGLVYSEIITDQCEI